MLGMTIMKKCTIFDTKQIPSEFLNDGIYANFNADFKVMKIRYGNIKEEKMSINICAKLNW